MNFKTGRHITLIQFLKFSCVGAAAALVNIFLRIVLSEFFGFTLSIILAYLAGMVTAYILNICYVFSSNPRSRLREITTFITYNLSVIPIVLGITYL